jgi:hypothetical protein
VDTVTAPGSEASFGRGAAIAKGILLAAAIAVVAAPLFLDPEKDWLRTGIPGWGVALTLVTLAVYGVLAWSGAALQPGPGGFRLRALDAVLLLALPFYALSTANGRLLTSGDNWATRHLGPLLVKKQTLDLSTLPTYQKRPLHYSAVRVGGRKLPAFPIGTGLLSVPYAAASLVLAGRETPQILDRSEKQCAALLTAASVVLLFLGIRRRFGEGPALGAAVVFALATPVLTTASQSLWSATGEIFFICFALFFVLPKDVSDAGTAAGGLAVAAAFLCRPTALLPAIFVGLALFTERRRSAFVYAAAAAAGVGVAALVLFRLYGHPLGAYGLANQASERWLRRPVDGFLGNLISPSRGLLPFFPYLLALPFARGALSRDRSMARWFWTSLGAVGSVYALASSYGKWWGGHGLGPRLMAEVSPFLALLTIPLWGALAGRRWARAFAVVTVAVAAATQVLGLYRKEAGNWNGDARGDTNRKALWALRQSQLLAIWWPQALAISPEPPDDESLVGSIDDPEPNADVAGNLLVRGWARIPGEDLAVAVLVDGEIRSPPSFRRTPRPDVCQVLPEMSDCGTAGYEAVLPFERGDSGRHELTVLFRAKDGRQRHYPPRDFQWTAPR